MAHYVVDASSWIDLERRHPEHISPHLWRNLERLIESGNISCPEAVRREIHPRRGSGLIDMHGRHQNMFEPDENLLDQVRTIMSRHAHFDLPGNYASPDTLVIALALYRSRYPCRAEPPAIIVTEETRRNRGGIPYVADAFQIESIRFLELICRELLYREA